MQEVVSAMISTHDGERVKKRNKSYYFKFKKKQMRKKRKEKKEEKRKRETRIEKDIRVETMKGDQVYQDRLGERQI